MIKIVAVSTLKPGVLQDYLQAAAELIEKATRRRGVFLIKFIRIRMMRLRWPCLKNGKMRKPSNCTTTASISPESVPSFPSIASETALSLFTRKSNKIDKGSAPWNFSMGRFYVPLGAVLLCDDGMCLKLICCTP